MHITCIVFRFGVWDGQLLTVEERKIGLQGFSDHWLESGMQLDHSKYAEKVSVAFVSYIHRYVHVA